MSDLLIQGLMCIISLPAAYFIIRLIFKESIVFIPGYLMVCYAIFVTFFAFWEATLGIKSALWIVPLVYGVGIGLLLIIKNILEKPLKKSILQLKDISQGNLRVSINHTDVKNELGILNNSILELSENLKRIIGDIASSSENLVSASQKTSDSSEQLSQGANEQASSIEEVSSTMEQISANIQQNTENSQQTEKISDEANQGVKIVSERLQKAVEANKEIASKITIINEIAFQTNLLALNAAVEAARAGEHGKGFAVVAAEVRKLAENSKNAAEEIVNLSRSALQITEEAGQVGIETIPKIEHTSRLIQEISAASMEQNNGASQVNNTIQQLNGIAQQNASLSEKFATNAEVLAGQAKHLRGAISFFEVEATQKT
ncbi:MAG: methyl-accepting chemotaxis protein [Bacteroidales bacterium]|nr:methyl-accepting chemotaxis protein [Bacteroidales bacterium]MDD4672537.1 methyl-accepting chemotaxis protein [Bacteroidales bacterium]MDY0349132.1 methyl-accepting chemotaxis protein [Tenuifilaceae bacterium]